MVLFSLTVHLFLFMVALKYASMVSGEQFVVITGITETQVSFADNLDLLLTVYISIKTMLPSIAY